MPTKPTHVTEATLPMPTPKRDQHPKSTSIQEIPTPKEVPTPKRYQHPRGTNTQEVPTSKM